MESSILSFNIGRNFKGVINFLLEDMITQLVSPRRKQTTVDQSDNGTKIDAMTKFEMYNILSTMLETTVY